MNILKKIVLYLFGLALLLLGNRTLLAKAFAVEGMEDNRDQPQNRSATSPAVPPENNVTVDPDSADTSFEDEPRNRQRRTTPVHRSTEDENLQQQQAPQQEESVKPVTKTEPDLKEDASGTTH